MKGAIDNIDMVIQTLEESGFSRDRFYIHCDGALFGMMLPLLKQVSQYYYCINFLFTKIIVFSLHNIYLILS